MPVFISSYGSSSQVFEATEWALCAQQCTSKMGIDSSSMDFPFSARMFAGHASLSTHRQVF
eukprot:5756441-Amphidinium_carterae.1